MIRNCVKQFVGRGRMKHVWGYLNATGTAKGKKNTPQRTSSSTVPSVLNDVSFYGDIVTETIVSVNEEV